MGDFRGREYQDTRRPWLIVSTRDSVAENRALRSGRFVPHVGVAARDALERDRLGAVSCFQNWVMIVSPVA